MRSIVKNFLELKTTCVINVHNGERFISRTIKSVLEQKKPVYLLVVDNASVDKTARIVQEFCSLNQNIQYKKTPCFMSLGEARNYSLSFVETDYVAWLDADDLWCDDFSFIGELLLNKYSNLGYITSDIEIINQNHEMLKIDVNPTALKAFLGTKPDGVSCQLYVGDSLEKLISRTHLTAGWSSYFFRRADVVNAGGFNLSFVYAEDYDMVVRVACKADGMHVGKVLSRARIHEKRVTTSINPIIMYDEINFIIYKYGNLGLVHYSILRALLSIKLMYWSIFKSAYRPFIYNIISSLRGVFESILIIFRIKPKKFGIKLKKYGGLPSIKINS